MKKYCVLCAATLVYAAVSVTADDGYIPKDGMVPDAATAMRIAEAVWIPIYGSNHIATKRPFVANLTNGVWYVRGSLPVGWLGGVPYAHIAKSNGAVLYIIHTK